MWQCCGVLSISKGICTLIELRMSEKSTRVSNLDNILKCHQLAKGTCTALRKGAYHAITSCTAFTPSSQLIWCFTNHILNKWLIKSLCHALSGHHVSYFAVSRTTSWKKGQSRHYANIWRCLIKNKSKNKLFYLILWNYFT